MDYEKKREGLSAGATRSKSKQPSRPPAVARKRSEALWLWKPTSAEVTESVWSETFLCLMRVSHSKSKTVDTKGLNFDNILTFVNSQHIHKNSKVYL